MRVMEGTRWEVTVGLIFTPALMRHLLGPLDFSRPMTSTSWTYSYSKQPIGRYNPPLATHPPTPTIYPAPPPSHPLIHGICDITVVKKVA